MKNEGTVVIILLLLYWFAHRHKPTGSGGPVAQTKVNLTVADSNYPEINGQSVTMGPVNGPAYTADVAATTDDWAAMVDSL